MQNKRETTKRARMFCCKAKHHLTIAHMMCRVWYRYTEKSIISWKINIFPDLLNQIQDRNLNILGKLSNQYKLYMNVLAKNVGFEGNYTSLDIQRVDPP